MKMVPTAIFIASITLPASALAESSENKQQGFQVSLGAGLTMAPTYLGDDDYQTNAFPNISLSYNDRLKISLRGIEYVAISQDGWSAGPVLSYDFGRDENPDDSPFAISGDTTTDLVGLGDIDGTVQLGGFVEYKARSFAAKIDLRQGLDGGHDGLFGDASVSYLGQLSALERTAFFTIGPSLSFGDDAYNSTFFDVTAAQSLASGISQYDADAGLNSFGVHATVMVPITDTVSLVGFAKYDKLTGDVGDSSIVNERGSKNQMSTGFFVNYTF